MFADPFSAVMALILLAFIGTLAIFFCIWRELDSLRRALHDIQESLEYHIADMDRQNHDLLNQPGPAQDAANDNLGTLLEKGLPNLVGNPAFGGVSPYDPEHVAAPSPADDDEDDFLRRLVSGPEKRV